MGSLWLVVMMHMMEDIPVRMFPTEDAAKAFIDANPILQKASGEWSSGPEVMRAYDVADSDAMTPSGYRIYEFRDGMVVGFSVDDECVRQIDDDGNEIEDSDSDEAGSTNDSADLLAEQLDGIFDGNAQYVIDDGTAAGPDGLIGMRLIVNCLHRYFDESGEPNDLPAPANRSDVDERLSELAKTTGATFVVCYQGEGNGVWEMRWSESLTPREAFKIMSDYVLCGLGLSGN